MPFERYASKKRKYCSIQCFNGRGLVFSNYEWRWFWNTVFKDRRVLNENFMANIRKIESNDSKKFGLMVKELYRGYKIKK